MQAVRVSQIRNVGIVFDRHIHLLQYFVGLFFGEFVSLFLLVLALFAHEYLLELFGKDVDVSGEEGKQV